jgi:hypothetical protein
MLSWFWPQCPLATAEKVWVEARLTWLAHQLGSRRLLESDVVEPTEDYFPTEYGGSESDARRIFGQLVKWMEIEPHRVGLEVSDQLSSAEALGEYFAGEPAIVRVRPALLEMPESLIATLTHELCHEILLGGGLLQDNNEDLERLTDLTQVYLGLGIFGANDALHEQTTREGRFSWWSIGKRGYLPMRMYGYGMALFAWARQENDPLWADHLRLDVREPLLAGLRYLRKTGDSTFNIHTAVGELPAADLERATSRLAHRSSSFRLLGLWDLYELKHEAAPAAAAVARLLHDRDADVSSTAAWTLGVLGQAALPHASLLQDQLASRRPADREAAAFALGEILPDDPGIVQDLGRLLDDNDRGAQAAAIAALGRFGSRASHLMPALLRTFQWALTKCDDRVLQPLAWTLQQVDPDARASVREVISPLGHDMLQFAEECLSLAAANEDCVDEIPAEESPQPPAGEVT